LDIAFDRITNPILEPHPHLAVRDPVIAYDAGVFHIYFSVVERGEERFRWFVYTMRSSDLVDWSEPAPLADSPLNFSSPGDIIRVDGKWVMPVQSYVTVAGERYGTEDSRLHYMTSPDLDVWSDPVPLNPGGANVNWTDSKRQIDPCFVQHDGRYWCFYKTSGCLGLLVSDDFRTWQEASPDRPVFAQSDTPDNVTVENPSVVRDGGEFVLFFTACRPNRSVGVARSRDLLNWRDVHYLDIADLRGFQMALPPAWPPTCAMCAGNT